LCSPLHATNNLDYYCTVEVSRDHRSKCVEAAVVSSWWSPLRDNCGGGGLVGRPLLSLFYFRSESCSPVRNCGTLAVADTPSAPTLESRVSRLLLVALVSWCSLDQGSRIFLAGDELDPGSFSVDLAVLETLRTLRPEKEAHEVW